MSRLVRWLAVLRFRFLVWRRNRDTHPLCRKNDCQYSQDVGMYPEHWCYGACYYHIHRKHFRR